MTSMVTQKTTDDIELCKYAPEGGIEYYTTFSVYCLAVGSPILPLINIYD